MLVASLPYASSMTRRVSTTRTIPAPAASIFDLLADPLQHVRLDGSGSLSKLKSSPERLYLGATFSMHMRLCGVPYITNNVVVVFEENRSIAWHHFAKFVWRYDLEEVDGATKVTESFDYSQPWGVFVIPLGFPSRNEDGMKATLERLESAVTL
jgi:uncharacterized protein YndB with AHSA1/START domain